MAKQATTKSRSSKGSASGIRISWRKLVIWASFAANIAFFVVLITMAATRAMDGLFISQGIIRYCDVANDDKFAGSTDQTKALRYYTCARGDANQYFQDGFKKYLDFKQIQY